MEDEVKDLQFVPIGNKRVKQKKDVFCKFVAENQDKEFYVCAHDNPDPDALSSAFGMARILQFLGVEVSLYYCGEISHPQNKAMQNVLGIPIRKWTASTKDEINTADVIFVFVDCCGRQKNMSIPFEPHIAVDHHKAVAAKNVIFIHEEVGACATLITDLMLSIPDEKTETSVLRCFDPNADDIREIATALAIGIKTDTIDFTSETTSEDDFKAYKFLSRFVSDDKFSKIVNYKLPEYVYESEEIAWKNKTLNGPNLLAGLGFLDVGKSDCIPYLADHLMRLEGIQTVLVYAIVGNTIKASLRTISASVDASALCSYIFGEGNGGGKHGIAGANVHFNVFDADEMDDDDKTKLWELTKKTIERKFFRE